MPIPLNVIANADDLGLSQSVNKAILFCFENEYINSASILTNTAYFEETVNLIHDSPSMHNIGIHINFAEGKPVTNFYNHAFLDSEGSWDVNKLKKNWIFLDKLTQHAFLEEIFAQVDKAINNKILINHIDSHHHLHTLPYFYKIFIEAARHYKLKLRLAQTYNEGNILKFSYRRVINKLIKLNSGSYSDYFEDVNHFLNSRKTTSLNKTVEIMFHPDFSHDGQLTDHFDDKCISKWLIYLNQQPW